MNASSSNVFILLFKIHLFSVGLFPLLLGEGRAELAVALVVLPLPSILISLNAPFEEFCIALGELDLVAFELLVQPPVIELRRLWESVQLFHRLLALHSFQSQLQPVYVCQLIQLGAVLSDSISVRLWSAV